MLFNLHKPLESSMLKQISPVYLQVVHVLNNIMILSETLTSKIYIYNYKIKLAYFFSNILNCIIFHFNKEILNDYESRPTFSFFSVFKSLISNVICYFSYFRNSNVRKLNFTHRVSNSKAKQ